jgi:hypothetical protein
MWNTLMERTASHAAGLMTGAVVSEVMLQSNSATAAPGDVVLLAGRGHRDDVEHFDGEDGIACDWFDVRWV